MANETTDLIKEKIDVADFIKQYVALTPAGKNLKGLCPFHKEKSPSFIVSPDRQMWHCFGCGKGGDIITFLMQYENIEFIEALKQLADKAGIELKRLGTQDQKKYDILYDINRVAKDFFKSSLHEDLGRPALKYLTGRGLKKETIDEFELGLALPTSDALTRHLTKMGFLVADIDRAGISFKTERGTYWDRFRNRIMFPLYNNFGKVVGFTGRVMPASLSASGASRGGPGQDPVDVPKYVNSPETPIFNKSKLLFGFFKSKNHIREASTVVLVEGQMDFLMAWQDGIKNLVATSGTALTLDHLKLVRRLAENLVLSFDNDSAGRAAAERTIDVAQANDFNVKVILFKDKNLKDPADIVKEKSGHFKHLIDSAVPAMEYYFDFYQVSRNQDIAAKKKSIRSALAKIKVISSPVEAQHWLNKLSAASGVPEVALTSEMATLKVNADNHALPSDVPGRGEAERVGQSRIDVMVRRLLSLILLEEKLGKEIEAERELIPLAYAPLLNYILNPVGSPPTDIVSAINLLYLESSLGDPTKVVTEWKELMARLRTEHNNTKKQELKLKIEEAEQTKNEGLLQRLLEEYRNLTQQV